MNKSKLNLVRTAEQLDLLRKSGEITAKVLKKVIQEARPGVALSQLDKIAEGEILTLGGGSSFKTVPGYRWTTCLTVNEEVVHGVPREIKLKEGDVLGIDLGAVFPQTSGWHTDAAWSIVVGGTTDTKKLEFLGVGERALQAAINQAVEGKRIGDISSAIQQTVEEAGFLVVKSLAGHGIGKHPHEEPEIPEYGTPGTGMVLKSGMALAIEVIYTSGSGEIYEKEDGWTLASKSGGLGGLFEMSVIVGQTPEVITDWRKV